MFGVFENRVLRRIFDAKRDEIMGDWRKLHNEELNDLYFSSSIIWVIKWRRMRWGVRHVAHTGERRCVYGVLVGKPEGRRPLGRHRCRCEDDIKMGLKIVGCGAWTGLIWRRIGTGGGHL